MKKIILLVIPFLCCSCMNSEFERILFRTNEDPFYDSPKAESVKLENTIFLTWQEDECADCYYLMKSTDSVRLNFECIYSGSGTSFTDTDNRINQCYVYRLDKKRGGKLFIGKTFSYGYGSSCRQDEYENNDTQETSTYLEYDHICNLPCVQYITEGKLHFDVDWFYVTVPPKRTAAIVVSQKGLENATTGANTALMFQLAGSSQSAVKQKSAITISNPSNVTRNFYFKIFPDTTALFSPSENCAVIEYTVSLNQIYNYEL